MEVVGVLAGLFGLLAFVSGLILKALPIKIVSAVKRRALVVSAAGLATFVVGVVITPTPPTSPAAPATSTPAPTPVPPQAAPAAPKEIEGNGWSSVWWYAGAGIAIAIAFAWGREFERQKLGLPPLGAKTDAPVSPDHKKPPPAPAASQRNVSAFAAEDYDDYDDELLEIAFDERWRPGDTGKAATFTYVDSDGVVTDRRVGSWRSDGIYIQAYCLDRRASRTFRKDRIEDWEGNER